MSHATKPTREPVTRCRAVCQMQGNGSPFKRGDRCECNAMPGTELCWTHCHAASNANRSSTLELIP